MVAAFISSAMTFSSVLQRDWSRGIFRLHKQPLQSAGCIVNVFRNCKTSTKICFEAFMLIFKSSSAACGISAFLSLCEGVALLCERALNISPFWFAVWSSPQLWMHLLTLPAPSEAKAYLVVLIMPPAFVAGALILGPLDERWRYLHSASHFSKAHSKIIALPHGQNMHA